MRILQWILEENGAEAGNLVGLCHIRARIYCHLLADLKATLACRWQSRVSRVHSRSHGGLDRSRSLCTHGRIMASTVDQAAFILKISIWGVAICTPIVIVIYRRAFYTVPHFTA
jgi:hypothetical protein